MTEVPNWQKGSPFGAAPGKQRLNELANGEESGLGISLGN